MLRWLLADSTGPGVLNNVYIVIAIIVGAGAIAGYVGRATHVYLKDRHRHDEEDRKVREAIIGIPAGDWGTGQPGLVSMMRDLTVEVRDLKHRVSSLEAHK